MSTIFTGIKNKIKSFMPNNDSDWFRLSLSLFLAGIIFVAIELIMDITVTSITAIASFCMGAALIVFPYGDKNTILEGAEHFLLYISYTIATIVAAIFWIAGLLNGNNKIWFSAIICIMIIIFLYITFLPLFKIITFIVKSIKQKANEEHNGSVITVLKCFFSGAGIVTAFLIAILTITKTTLEILKIISKS